jgi:hypothetical protein
MLAAGLLVLHRKTVSEVGAMIGQDLGNFDG